jgi:hypothetical protein
MRIVLLCLGIILAGSIQAQVYRTVDKDGNVVFSDQATEGAVEVEVKELESIRSLEPPPGTVVPSTSQKAQPLYTSLEITSPGNDESIRENSGNLVITAMVTPRLRAGDRVVLFLDGQQYASGTAFSFKLENLDRGTHQARVAILDTAGAELISSGAVTFHMLRFSALQPGGAKPPPAT